MEGESNLMGLDYRIIGFGRLRKENGGNRRESYLPFTGKGEKKSLG